MRLEHDVTMLIQRLLTLLIAIVFSLVASARVLVDTGPLYPSLENPTSNFSPAVGDQFQAADQFTLTSRALIRRIDFFGLYGGTNGMSSPPIQDDFTIRIFADTNGAPTALPIAECRVGQIKRKLALHSGPLDYFGYRAIRFSATGESAPCHGMVRGRETAPTNTMR